MITIAFTGHRPNKLWGYNTERMEYDKLLMLLIDTIEKIIEEKYPEEKEFVLINGMAIGVDQLACTASLLVKKRMKDKDINIMVEAAVPCLYQEKKWPAATQKRYHDLLKHVDKITITNGRKPTVLTVG